MGKLRIEPKGGPPNSMEQRQIAMILREAYENSDEYDFFWNLDDGEDRARVRRQFEYVAMKENIPLKVRVLRKNKRFHLTFKKGLGSRSSKFLLERYKNKIIAILEAVGEPMSRKDILIYGQLNPNRWRPAILALKKNGVILQEGHTRNLRYRLAPPKSWTAVEYPEKSESDNLMPDPGS